MLSYQDMPENNKDLAKIEVSFPYLMDNSLESCPVKCSEIINYLESEAASEETIEKGDLKFIRTAQVAEDQYWIWEFYDSENRKCYVIVSRTADGNTYIVFDEDYYHLTPEQFILGIYHNVF